MALAAPHPVCKELQTTVVYSLSPTKLFTSRALHITTSSMVLCSSMPDQQLAFCRRMSSAVAEAEKSKAAGDAHKRDLVQAKLVEREAELASMRDKLRAANREVSSESTETSLAAGVLML